MDINEKLARRLTLACVGNSGLSIEELANRNGVSRAMIKEDDKGNTAAVLDKLSIRLGILLPDLFQFACRFTPGAAASAQSGCVPCE